MNRTKTGVTVETADWYLENVYEGDDAEYDIYDDIKNNAFALKMNEDGSVGYKYGILDCDAEHHYSVVEEYSNCTVQILRNSVTGEETFGWYDNDNPPAIID